MEAAAGKPPASEGGPSDAGPGPAEGGHLVLWAVELEGKSLDAAHEAASSHGLAPTHSRAARMVPAAKSGHPPCHAPSAAAPA